ncbi:hypothetical protein BDV93DRAFT_561378 [Ceratobasidium sp. AG-I]|nr:hypothetical protein BDV93DRAFT_561378 [Ceratobasidium sp. AG-I]
MSAIRTDDAARAAVMERLSSEAAVCVLLGLARLSPTAPRSLGILVTLSSHALTSREARQALSGLRSTDPEFYQEIMSGHSEVPSGKEEDEEPDFEDDEINADCTLPELIKQVLSTAKLDKLPGSSRNVDEQSDGYESEEYGYSAPVYLAAPCS